MRGFAAILPVLCALLPAAPLQALIDDFEEDPTTSPDWEYYEPLLGATTSTEDGFFRFTFPFGLAMDHWLTVDNAVQLRRSDMPEDFIIETRVYFVGAGDPEFPLWPPPNEPYQTGLMVHFSRFDVFQFGMYRGTGLYVERSGQNGLCVVDPGLQELSLQIKKTGTLYSFSWRETDGDPWNLLCTQTAVELPQYVGLIFKTWGGGLTQEETFEFDYFSLEEVPEEAPSVALACPAEDPDTAWLNLPYVRALQVSGFPLPTVQILSGPPGITYDETTGLLGGWTPDSFNPVEIELEASSALGVATETLNVEVAASAADREDEFDDDPRDNPDFWELYELQFGVLYSTVVEDDDSWWRMDVPLTGDLGLNWDTWVGVDRAPQLRHLLTEDEDFLIETRVRIAQQNVPAIGASFLAGLMVNFNGGDDLIHWNIGGERLVNGELANVFAERSGTNNLCLGYVEDVILGRPVDLRLERRCDLYTFFYRGDGDQEWIHAGSHRTPDAPLYVGLIMKTWGGGTAWVVDFDYFDILSQGPIPSFTIDPAEGVEPLEVTVDATSATSQAGAITDYEWDFGDGTSASGMVQTHTYDSRGDYRIRLAVTDEAGETATSTQMVRVLFRSEDVSPWTATDVGDPPPVTAGGARLEAPDCVRVFGGGAIIGGLADQFHYVHQSVTGDGSITARIASADWPVASKVGVMLREDLSPGSRHASMLLVNFTNGGQPSFLQREVAQATTAMAVTTSDRLDPPDILLRMERIGDDLVGSYSSDGVSWEELSRVNLALPPTIHFGLAVTARDLADAGLAAEVEFCEVALEGEGGGSVQFGRGDSDANGGAPNITDGIFVLNFLFLGGETPPCMDAADADDNGSVNITDGIYVLNFLFLGGPAPPAPVAPDCSLDTTASGLTCESFPPCGG